MLLFKPATLGCPLCYPQGSSRHGVQARSQFTDLSDGRLKGLCGHEFTLYDALKVRSTFGTSEILGVFSHDESILMERVVPGRIVALRTGAMPPFRVFTLQVLETNPYLLSQLAVLKDDQAIFVTSLKMGDAPPIKDLNLMATMHSYDGRSDKLWLHLFYDSLADLVQLRNQSAIIKLAASIDVFADDLFERYLKRCPGLAENVIEKIVTSARNWEAKIDRTSALAAALLGVGDQAILRSARKPYEQKVRTIRNGAAHPSLGELGRQEAEDAFRAAFDILWIFDRLNDAI